MIRKFYWCLLILAASLALCSCEPQETYDDGFQDGYSEGRWDAELKYADSFSNGYNEGLLDGFKDGFREVLDYAEHYALKKSGCSPFEAVDIVSVYLDAENPQYETTITEDEFRSAVNSLSYFYECIRSENPD